MLEYNLDISPRSYCRYRVLRDNLHLFPLFATEFGFFDAGPDYYTKRGAREFSLLLYTVGGAGELTWKDQTVLLRVGEAVLIRCDSYHEYRTAAGHNRWEFYWAHMGGSGLNGYEDILLSSPTPVRLSGEHSPEAQLKILEEYSAQDSLPAYAEVSHALSGILLGMFRNLHAYEHVYPDTRSVVVHNVMSYIETNYRESLCLEDMTRQVNLSKYHLIRMFSKEIGVTPYQYMQQFRVKKACEKLLTTNLTIQEIGVSVGYGDTTGFIRSFRKWVGMTPDRYRKTTVRICAR